MSKFIRLSALAVLIGSGPALMAQEAEEKPIYQITETVNVKHTPVDNQGSSGTC